MDVEMFCKSAQDLKPCTCIIWNYIKLKYGKCAAFAIYWTEVEKNLYISRTQFFKSMRELREKNYLHRDEKTKLYSF